VEQPPQPPQEPPKPQPQPWGGRPWGRPQAPQPPPAPRPWGEPPAPRQPWGYRPPTPPPEGPRPPGAPRPWYRHPVGLLLAAAVVLIVLTLVVPWFTGGGGEPAPTVTSGNFASPPTTAPPAATTTTRPAPAAEQLGQAVQDELGGAGEVTSLDIAPGGKVTVIWQIRRAGSQGLTENNARFGVMRILRVIQQTQFAGGTPAVRLVGQYQQPGSATPATVVRLRFDPDTVERGDFSDQRYLEAFDLADAAVVAPSFRG
jgi:hypothetical protein